LNVGLIIWRAAHIGGKVDLSVLSADTWDKVVDAGPRVNFVNPHDL
jgi:hypothetical protein